MKKTLPVFIISSLLILSAQNSFAQNFLAPIQAENASSTNDSASSTKARDIQLQNIIENKIGKPLDGERFEIAKGFENAIASLNNLVSRIGSRIAKMQAAGIDVSSSSALFESVKENLAISGNALTDLENTLALPTSTSTRTVILSRIKNQDGQTKILVQSNYSAIENLINLLKEESQTALSTDTATSSGTSQE